MCISLITLVMLKIFSCAFWPNYTKISPTLVIMASIKKPTTVNAGEEVGEREPLTLLVEMQIGSTLWRIVRSFLKKLKVGQPYDPTSPGLGM